MYATIGSDLPDFGNDIPVEEPADIRGGGLQDLHIFLYNPTLLPDHCDRKNEDACQDAKILFFHPQEIDIHEKRKQAGLWEGAIGFMSSFWQDSEDYFSSPIETINTSLFTAWIKEVEKDMFLWLLLSHENLYTDNAADHDDSTISSYDPTYGIFKEEDTQILTDTLKMYYDLFSLFHLSLHSVHERGPKYLENVLEDFTIRFDKHFFMDYWGRLYFNNSAYRGFPICPLDSKLYLYAQKYAHSVDVPKMAIFYQEYFVYGNIPTCETEVLYNYLIGPMSQKWEGFIPNWTSHGLQGKTMKLLRKRIKNSSSRVTESDLEEEKMHDRLEHTDINYEEYVDDDDYYTDFCRINRQGHVGKNQQREGFLIGPSVFKKIDKSNPEDLKTYEIFSPTVYIKNDVDSQKTYSKLIVMVFKKMMFVYLLENEQLEEHEYTLMYERTKTAATNLIAKIAPTVDSYNENHTRYNSKVKFYYYNETNLAVKYSPSVPSHILTTELRHFLNIIKAKFDNNPDLMEYKMTASDFWMIGVKSLTRLVILLIPVSYSNTKMEAEKDQILKKYFSQFIF